MRSDRPPHPARRPALLERRSPGGLLGCRGGWKAIGTGKVRGAAWIAGAALFTMAPMACSSASPAADLPQSPPTVEGPAPIPAPVADAPPPPVAVVSPDLPEPAGIAAPECGGVLVQGGIVICHTEPGTPLKFGSVTLTADATGTVQFGLAQKSPLKLDITGKDFAQSVTIAPRNDAYREVPGFDCDKIDARTPAQKAHAARSWETKQAAFNELKPGQGALAGFIRPSAAPPSSPFGPTRKYFGVSKDTGQPCESVSIHQGYDMAAPIGTDVVAPAAGIVTLADPDLYYEGGAIFLDHGHGLLSVFMHLSEVSVSTGDIVARGDLIARTGNTGRSTGPHLHWGVKWRNPASGDRRSDYYIDPALLLDLPLSE